MLSGQAPAQDIEPRRWTPIPLGVNVVGAGYGHTSGEIFVDPVLRIEDAEFDADTVGVSYVRSFSLAGKSARFDALLPWSSVRWSGLLDGQPAATERTGLADPRLRLSVILGGPPAMEAGKLRSYMAGRPVHTEFGAAISITLPWGEYFDDKLLNLGQNRLTIRPQIGIVHTRGPWSYELTGSTFVFGDNDDFFFKPGLWASLSAGYGWGGRYTLDGERRNERADFLAAFSVGFPLGRRQGLKIAYLRSETREATGSESDTLAIAWSVRY
jgi:hypothetical protein